MEVGYIRSKIIICGGRHFDNYDYLSVCMDKILEDNNLSLDEIEIVSGHCEGADQLGEKYAAELNLKCTIFPAEWNRYGRSAGPIRNSKMVDYIKTSDNPIVIAFVNENTKGTRNTISIAEKYNIPTYQFEYNAYKQ